MGPFVISSTAVDAVGCYASRLKLLSICGSYATQGGRIGSFGGRPPRAMSATVRSLSYDELPRCKILLMESREICSSLLLELASIEFWEMYIQRMVFSEGRKVGVELIGLGSCL